MAIKLGSRWTISYQDGVILREQLFDQCFDPGGYAKIDQCVAD